MLVVMNRRTFAGALAGLAAARPMWPADTQRRTNFYMITLTQLKQGTQGPRMNDWIKNSLLPAMEKVHSGPKIVLESVIAPHNPQIAVITGYSSLDDIQKTGKALATPEMTAAWAKIESGPEPPFESQSVSIYEAASYSPEPAIARHDKPRYFELRQYHAPTRSQLRDVHERFNGPEIRVFHRSGIFPVFYTSGMIGGNLPNLTYLIPFESLGAREKAWDAFNADPEWIKARKDSIDAHGQIVAVTDVSIYKATAYSPIS